MSARFLVFLSISVFKAMVEVVQSQVFGFGALACLLKRNTGKW
jgi:hypothetical protein